MTGRPDYDAGDLVVCVDATPHPIFGAGRCKLHQVHIVRALCSPESTVQGIWGFFADCDGLGRPAYRYRKLDRLPPEFWAGAIDADTPEQVLA